jgi:putative endonuclease
MSRQIGQLGEEMAVSYLKSHGYEVVARNVVMKGGELDVVAKDRDGTLVFCEVKYYAPGSQVHPLEAITYAKQKRLIKSAQLYLLRMGNCDIACRFDAIVVKTATDMLHLKNIIIQ